MLYEQRVALLPMGGCSMTNREENRRKAIARMNGITTASGQEIGAFSFALRAKVRDGQVVLWHWFEDSFALSQAYHGR